MILERSGIVRKNDIKIFSVKKTGYTKFTNKHS